MEKALIFDASSIITLALNNLLSVLKPLKERFQGNFFITEKVKYEIIDKPIQEKRFMLEALFIKKLFEEEILSLYPVSFKNQQPNFLDIANSTFSSGGEPIKILHPGESSCLSLFNNLKIEKKAIVVDERTTRMLCEAPENLHKLLESKLHKKIIASEKNYGLFKNFKIIRSSELAIIAYKLGLINLPGKKQDVINALLYAEKFGGCAISNKEIESVSDLI